MIIKNVLGLGISSLIFATSAGLAAPASPELSLELGSAWQARNSVQISNEAPNTRIDLDAITGSGPYTVDRMTLDWPTSRTQALRLTVAPLLVEERGTLEEPVIFQGITFNPGTLQTKYKFNSYRLGWRKQVHQSEDWSWDLGGTLNVRDAEIRLSQNGISSTKDDLGVVPLLSLIGEWRFAPKWRSLFDFEGMAADQGRAVDVAVKVAYDATDRLSFNGGYRMLDGGADTEELYTFAHFDQAVLGVSWKLR